MAVAAGPLPTSAGSTEALRAGLLEHGLLVATGVPGLYVRSGRYEAVVAGIGRAVTEVFAPLRPEMLHVPAVLARATFARTSFLDSFPDLVGSVHVFRGGDGEHRALVRQVAAGEGGTELLEPGETVLSPSACHALYPLCTGRLPEGGRTFEVQGSCFRHEPSDDPARMQAFRMHELVFLGDAAGAERHRDEVLAGAVALLERLALRVAVVPANDPFFGRLGTVLARRQREEALKLEAVVALSGDRPTAVVSGNCHRDHFGAAFAIEQADGSVAHSACVGLGVDRIALALFAAHGFERRAWPGAVLELLGLRP